VGSEDLLDHGRRIAALESKVAELYKRLGQAEPASGFGGGFGDPLPGADEDPRVIELLQAGQKIQAIKLYCELTGVGLKEAKDAVERLSETYGAT
jgi:large subunit ribosomal protein L7/L12